jgi:hypothetical protein
LLARTTKAVETRCCSKTEIKFRCRKEESTTIENRVGPQHFGRYPAPYLSLPRLWQTFPARLAGVGEQSRSGWISCRTRSTPLCRNLASSHNATMMFQVERDLFISTTCCDVPKESLAHGEYNCNCTPGFGLDVDTWVGGKSSVGNDRREPTPYLVVKVSVTVSCANRTHEAAVYNRSYPCRSLLCLCHNQKERFQKRLLSLHIFFHSLHSGLTLPHRMVFGTT